MLLTVSLLLGSTAAWSAPAPFPNGGFEQPDAQAPAKISGWTSYGDGYEMDTQTHHGGANSLRRQNLGGGQTGGAFVAWNVNQTRTLPILISGWSKALDVDGVTDNDYSVYVDVNYTDGSSLWGQTAPFETGTHDWKRQQLMLFPSKPVKSLNIYALFRNHTGTAWFDDF
ncbi:MAG: hypothetical protein JWQ02_2818, partial [Capsulimonas sp.]|nr:hypothetical protein [Capsulimonas sp.]